MRGREARSKGRGPVEGGVVTWPGGNLAAIERVSRITCSWWMTSRF